jgi:hypothetical protein
VWNLWDFLQTGACHLKIKIILLFFSSQITHGNITNSMLNISENPHFVLDLSAKAIKYTSLIMLSVGFSSTAFIV